MADCVLVTGGAGYIGSHAVLALLESGREVVVVDDFSTGARGAVPSGVAVLEADVADGPAMTKVLKDRRIRSVLHFAGSIIVAESVANPAKYYANNTAASLSLVGSCLAAGVDQFVFSSTAAVYDPEAGVVDEDAPLRPVSPYGASKLMSERVLEDVSRAHPAFRPVRLRYFNVAGADPAGRAGQQGPQATHLIRMAIDTALGRREALDIFGTDYPTRDGTCERDFIHVSDLVDAHVAVLDHLDSGGAGGVYNCGYGRGYSVLEVVQAFGAHLGRPIPTRAAPRRPGDAPRSISDPGRLQRDLGWTPRRASLADIIRTALRWEQVHGGRSADKHA